MGNQPSQSKEKLEKFFNGEMDPFDPKAVRDLGLTPKETAKLIHDPRFVPILETYLLDALSGRRKISTARLSILKMLCQRIGLYSPDKNMRFASAKQHEPVGRFSIANRPVSLTDVNQAIKRNGLAHARTVTCYSGRLQQAVKDRFFRRLARGLKKRRKRGITVYWSSDFCTSLLASDLSVYQIDRCL